MSLAELKRSNDWSKGAHGNVVEFARMNPVRLLELSKLRRVPVAMMKEFSQSSEREDKWEVGLRLQQQLQILSSLFRNSDLEAFLDRFSVRSVSREER